MLTFWIIAALLILLALWFILPALLQKPGTDEEVERREANILVYKDQHRELDEDLNNGLIGTEQYELEKAELERRLLEDVMKAKSEITAAGKHRIDTFTYGVVAFITVGAVALYFVVGNPKAVTSAGIPAAVPQSAPNQPGVMSDQQIAANIQKLADRLKQ